MAPLVSPAPRILLVRVGAMGDVLHALPAAAFLRAHLPDAFLGWAIEPRWSSLLQANEHSAPRSAAMPIVDRVHPVATREWSKHPVSATTARSVMALRRDLRSNRYDLALDLQGSLRSAAIARFSGAPLVVGAAVPRETPARWLYRNRVATAAPHVIDQAIELARAALAHFAQGHATAPDLLPRDSEAEAWADTLHLPQRTVFLAPTAGWGAKQWPADRFAALAAALARQGCRVLLNATPPLPDTVAETVYREALAQLPPQLHGSLATVAATLPQLTAVLRRVNLAVAGDTGPLHLAAALGIPAVALFGPTDPARNGPHSTNSIVLRDAGSITDHRRHPQTEAGLARIGVDTVLDAAMTLLR